LEEADAGTEIGISYVVVPYVVCGLTS
jgi:hypothetical protein